MEVFLSVEEVTNLLGVSKQAVQKNCKAKKYTTQQVPAKGGKGGLKYEIALSSLPQAAQDAYYRQHAQQLLNENAGIQTQGLERQTVEDIPQVEQALKDYAEQQKTRYQNKENGLAEFAKLPQAKKDHARAKQRLVMACYQFIRERGLKKLDGIARFCEAVNQAVGDSDSNEIAEAISLPVVLRAVIPARHGVQHLNPVSFKRWLYDYEAEGIIALVDDYGKRAGHSTIETHADLKRYVLGFMLRFPYTNAVKVKQAIQAQKPELDLVGERSIDRFMSRWKADNAQVWTYITHPDKWKSIYMPAYGSHFDGVERLNQIWEMDSTPGDWLLTDGRHSVLGVVDLYSRRLSFHVSKTSSGQAVCLAFRKAVLAWGVPETVRTDNGKDYVSNRFDTALRDLEITQQLCVPFASEEKGTIERHLGTMLHGLLELLPGFTGHNVAEAQRIRSMKSFAQRIMTPNEVVEVSMSAHELQDVLDRWANVIYAQDKHSGLKGRTPNQVTALYSGSVRRISDERALDMLLAEIAGTRTLNKKGIRFNNRDYLSPELAIYAGKEAVLKYDDADMGRLFVYVENRFVCVAECPELTGISRAEVAVVTKNAIKKQLNKQAKELKAYKKEVADDIPNLVINHRIETSDNVEFFPRPAKEHNTPALEQAAVADRTRRGVVQAAASIDPEKLAEGKAQVLAFLNTIPEENPIEMNDVQRWRYWNRLHDKQSDGGVLSEKELAFYSSFQNSNTFKSFMSVQNDLTQQA